MLDTKLGFMNDDWWFLIYRRGWSPEVFLRVHIDHIAIAPVAIYKILVSVFGMSSAMPFHIAATLVFLLADVLLFAWLRRRVGDWLALFAAVVILFFGPSWVDLLWAFQIGYFGSLAAGIGALLALDRHDRSGDRLACALVIVSISFSELGVPFAIGAFVHAALGDPPRRRRLYVGLVPLALYALWYLGWGRSGMSSFSLHNVANSPTYVIDAAAAGLSALLGLATPPQGLFEAAAPLAWGQPLLIAAVLLAVWRLWRLGRVSRDCWVVFAIAGSLWVLAAFNATIGRLPDNGRYLLPSGVFLLLIAAELLRGVTLSRRALVATAAVTVITLISNLAFLRDGFDFWRLGNEQARADVGALEITRPATKPGYYLNGDISPVWLLSLNAASYFSAVDAYGSPAYTEAELAARPDDERAEADRVLAGALGIRLQPLARGEAKVDASGRCRTVRASGAGSSPIDLESDRTALISRGAAVEVDLERFSDALPVKLGKLPPSGGALQIPHDLSSRPWRLALNGRGPVSVCP